MCCCQTSSDSFPLLHDQSPLLLLLHPASNETACVQKVIGVHYKTNKQKKLSKWWKQPADFTGLRHSLWIFSTTHNFCMMEVRCFLCPFAVHAQFIQIIFVHHHNHSDAPVHTAPKGWCLCFPGIMWLRWEHCPGFLFGRCSCCTRLHHTQQSHQCNIATGLLVDDISISEDTLWLLLQRKMLHMFWNPMIAFEGDNSLSSNK